MTKKILSVAGIANELEGASLYFSKPIRFQEKKPDLDPAQNNAGPVTTPVHSPHQNLNFEERSAIVADQVEEIASMPASKYAGIEPVEQDDFIEAIRKTVKQVGREALFVRLTSNEKHRLSSIAYTFNEKYRGEGRKTSENEICRVGLSWLFENYRVYGEQSILARVLMALNA
jgi:hypothetical protein